jgi:branched-chain amino acid aminotransferase
MGRPMAVINGELKPLAEASIGILDLGFLRGLAVFSTIQSYKGGCPYALPAHLERLWRGAAEIGVAPFFDEDAIRALLVKGYRASGYDEVSFSIMITPGELVSGYFDSSEPTVVILVRPLPSRPASQRRDGVGVHTFEAARTLPGVKTTNYLLGRHGLECAAKTGAHEAVYREASGLIREGVTSNVLLVRGQQVRSPDTGCLEGITRSAVRRAVEGMGLDWCPGSVYLEDLLAADEVWISSSIREVLPVVEVDGQPVANGQPGPVFRAMYTRLRSHFEATARADNAAYLARRSG